MGDAADMRVSLPPGTMLRGKNGSYKVINLICRSERSITVSCQNEGGTQLRLKYYNGNSSLTEAAQKASLLKGVRGVLFPCDIGEYSGHRFYVFPEIDATDAEQYPVSIHTLISKVIPMLAEMINQYHQKGVLLRDICPSHILYKPNNEQFAYCGFGNIALLKGKAATTKLPGYGQHYSYIAPEVETKGYSRASDYYSLGVTILSLLKGKNPFADVSKQDLPKLLASGHIQGIDIQHLRQIPYEQYTDGDRVQLLVCGLTLANPEQRWEYGEIRCWCNRQNIPLIQKGQRIHYRFDSAFIVNNAKCWNEGQLAETLAVNQSAWTDSTLCELNSFVESQGLQQAASINAHCSDSSLTSKGKLFRCIYELHPTLNGLWWDGKTFSDTNDLVKKVRSGALSTDSFSELLKNRCLSFFEDHRRQLGITSGVLPKEIEAIEQLEQQEPGKGVNRGLMLFVPDKAARSFAVEGKNYRNVTQLLESYRNNGKRLCELSADIIRDASFQAWLWANGMEKVGKEAAAQVESEPEKSLYYLLRICESAADSDKARELARGMYLKWGDFAPVVWLCTNISHYVVSNPLHQPLYDTLGDTKFPVNETMDSLRNKASQQTANYQLFVSRTLANPFLQEAENVENLNCGYIPVYESGFFCTTWKNGMEVCPEFLTSTGDDVNREDIDKWLSSMSTEVVNVLNEKAGRLQTVANSYGSIPGETDYADRCSNNMVFSVVTMAFACILLWKTRTFSFFAGLIAFVIGMIFPVQSFLWYYRQKVRVELWLRNKQNTLSNMLSVDDHINAVRERSNAIRSGIISRKTIKCNTTQDGIRVSNMSLDSPKELELSLEQRVLACISMFGYGMLPLIASGGLFGSAFFFACFYLIGYGMVAPYFIKKKHPLNSCTEWSLITLLLTVVSLIGISIGGSIFYEVVVLVPVVVVIALGVLLLFI